MSVPASFLISQNLYCLYRKITLESNAVEHRQNYPQSYIGTNSLTSTRLLPMGQLVAST